MPAATSVSCPMKPSENEYFARNDRLAGSRQEAITIARLLRILREA